MADYYNFNGQEMQWCIFKRVKKWPKFAAERDSSSLHNI